METGTDRFAASPPAMPPTYIAGVSGLVNALGFGLLSEPGDTATRTVVVELDTPPTLTATPGTPRPDHRRGDRDGGDTDSGRRPPDVTLTQPTKGAVSDPTLSARQPVPSPSGLHTPRLGTARAQPLTTPAPQTNPTASPSLSMTVTAHSSVYPVVVVSPPPTTAPSSRRSSPGAPTQPERSLAPWYSPTVTATPSPTPAAPRPRRAARWSTPTAPSPTPTDIARNGAAITDSPDVDRFDVTVRDGYGAAVVRTITVDVTPLAVTGIPTTAQTTAALSAVIDERNLAQAQFASALNSLAAPQTTIDANTLAALLAQLQPRPTKPRQRRSRHRSTRSWE